MMMDEMTRFVLCSMILQSYTRIVVKTILYHEELVLFEGDSISAMWPHFSQRKIVSAEFEKDVLIIQVTPRSYDLYV